MKEVGHHSASVVVVGRNLGKILLQIYDINYPVQIFRDHFIFLGGTVNGETSPMKCMRREVTEEISSHPPDKRETVGKAIVSKTADRKADDYLKGRKYASEPLIDAVRQEILKNALGFRDYMVRVEKTPISAEEDLSYISSVFLSTVDDRLLDTVHRELQRGREISNEGHSRICTPYELAKGKIRGSWGCATVLGDVMNESLPEYDFLQAVSLNSRPLESFAEYKKEFSYKRDPESKR